MPALSSPEVMVWHMMHYHKCYFLRYFFSTNIAYGNSQCIHMHKCNLLHWCIHGKEPILFYMLPKYGEIIFKRDICTSYHQINPDIIFQAGQWSLQWHHYERNGVSNHQPHNSQLFTEAFIQEQMKTSKLRVAGLCAWNSPVTGDSPHKGPVTRKVFAFDDIMIISHFTGCVCSILSSFNQTLGYCKGTMDFF